MHSTLGSRGRSFGRFVAPPLSNVCLCCKSDEWIVPPGVAGGVKDGESNEAGTPGVTSFWSCSVLLAGLARFLVTGFDVADGTESRALEALREMPLTASLG